MEPVRKSFGQPAGANRSMARVEVLQPRDAAGRTTAAEATPPSGKPVSATTPTERRLKLIIESAPVSLIIIDSQGRTLAANRASLALFGAARLEDVVAKNFAARVCPEDREAFVAFVTNVCQGQSESLKYEMDGFDGARRGMETQAVPLKRDGGAAAFLGASWKAADRREVGEMQSKYEQLVAERDALNDSLASTKAVHEETSREWEAERGLLEKRVRDAEERFQVALTESTHRQEELAQQWSTERETLTSQWTAERESLVATVRQAEEQHSAITTQLAAEQVDQQNALGQARNDLDQARNDLDQAKNEYQTSLAAAIAQTEEQRTAFEAVRREHEAALTARIEENRELESSLSSSHERYEAAIAESRATCDDLRGTIRDLEQRANELLSERNVERAAMENAVKGERARCESLVEERGQWLAELAQAFEPLRESSARVGRLLSAAAFVQPGTTHARENSEGHRDQPTEGSNADSNEEATWQF